MPRPLFRSAMIAVSAAEFTPTTLELSMPAPERSAALGLAEMRIGGNGKGRA